MGAARPREESTSLYSKHRQAPGENVSGVQVFKVEETLNV
jgi:hypothetical protein